TRAQADRRAASHAALIGRRRGVAENELHARWTHVEFFGDDLGERRVDAHADFELAGESLHATVGQDVQPRLELRRRRRHRPWHRRRGRLREQLRCERGVEHAEADHQAAGVPDEFASRQTGLWWLTSRHHALLLESETRLMAAKIRVWLPQRQMRLW